jgi:hypothetical protein
MGEATKNTMTHTYILKILVDITALPKIVVHM